MLALESNGGMNTSMSERCEYVRAISGIGISLLFSGMNSHSVTIGRSRLTYLSNDSTTSSDTRLPQVLTLPVHVDKMYGD